MRSPRISMLLKLLREFQNRVIVVNGITCHNRHQINLQPQEIIAQCMWVSPEKTGLNIVNSRCNCLTNNTLKTVLRVITS